MKNKAVILDRDGTINVEKNYLYKIEDFEFIDGAPEAIKLLNDNGYKVIVITNQAGVARGYYTEKDVVKLHKYIDTELEKYGAHVDKYYYCPHHPEEGIGEYKIKCDCRKPKNRLYVKAIKDFNIDINKSFVIGDKESDLFPGKELGLVTILVCTGHGDCEKLKNNFEYTEDLIEAVKNIVLVNRF